MSVTPNFVGQRYKDTNTGNIWIANSTTPGDFSLELQNAYIEWLPRTTNLMNAIGLFTYGDLSGITSIIFKQSSAIAGFDIESTTSLQSASFPNLVSVDALNVQGGGFTLSSNAALASISAPVLESVAGPLYIVDDAPVLTSLDLGSLQSVGLALTIRGTSLTAISLPNLVTVGGDVLNDALAMTSNANLATIDLSSYVPTNGTNIDLGNCALLAASVNHVLARCVANAAYVSGSVKLGAGTNASPTGQGILDVATLTGRGVAVTTN